MKILKKPITPNYKKISEELKKMIYGAAFECTGEQNLNQLPIIIDALSYFLATADGNAFDANLDNGKQFHQQYDHDSIEILIYGIKEYMNKNGINEQGQYGIKNSLNLCLTKLEELQKKG
jgi:hypothetical protein